VDTPCIVLVVLSIIVAQLLKSVGFIGFANKNNINIGPEVRLKKNLMFHFLPEICTCSA
jgi:hypothetical protein